MWLLFPHPRCISVWWYLDLRRSDILANLLLCTVLDRILWRIFQQFQAYGPLGVLLQGLSISLLSIPKAIQWLPSHLFTCKRKTIVQVTGMQCIHFVSGILCHSWVPVARLADDCPILCYRAFHLNIHCLGNYCLRSVPMAVALDFTLRMAFYYNFLCLCCNVM